MIILYILIAVIGAIALYMNMAPQFGGKPSGSTLTKMQNSANFDDGKFQNLVETPMSGDEPMYKSILGFITPDDSRTPANQLETAEINNEMYQRTDTGISVTWLGHSTVLLNINGINIITDPVFAESSGPVSFLGVKQFDFSNQYSIDDLPKIDIVLISHDHYDHLDYDVIKALKDQEIKFYVPLGVLPHIVRWGVAEEKIIELDWWENNEFDANIKITAAPARHFSGRGFKRNPTLWCSWAIHSGNHSVYFGGDSGYEKHFKEIGEKLGPFDLTLMECGQYNEGWPFIHMMPEQTVQAHIDVKGKYLLPIHWAKFKLSLHSWTEPIERAYEKAKEENVDIITPRIGEAVQLGVDRTNEEWWR